MLGVLLGFLACLGVTFWGVVQFVAESRLLGLLLLVVAGLGADRLLAVPLWQDEAPPVNRR